jgi:hypothetical protein
VPELLQVSCTDGEFDIDNSTYIAPVIVQDITVTCTATAEDQAGNQGTADLTVTVIAPPDTTNPSVSFDPNQLTLLSGQSGTAILQASDNVGVVSLTTSCSGGGSFSDNVFTAPEVTEDITVTCTATAEDEAGNQGTADLTVMVVAPDAISPVVNFDPNQLTILSGQSDTVILQASDNVGVVSLTTSCSNGGSFSNNVFTAPINTNSQPFNLECTAIAIDAEGNQGSAILSVTVLPDTTAPVISFSVSDITVGSNKTVQVGLDATDDVGVISVTTTCTGGGTYADGTFFAPSVTETTNLTCTATAEDAAGNTADALLNVTVTPAPDSVLISGKITYDLVPLNTVTNGLNYSATAQTAAPGITVEARDANGNILESNVTNSNGFYSLSITPEIDVQIVARAEMLQEASTGAASWDVKVIDNTNNDAIYELTGNLSTSGSSNSTRNLNADSGWGGNSYTGTRAAAPFAMLAPTYTAIQKMIAGDPDAAFPVMKFNWSVNNRAVSGNDSIGDIGTSSYKGNGNVYILGDANSDTDEYDDHVVVHEWGHYFEDQMSRSDSIGGPHSGGQKLDMRVAMGEGFGNALSGMVTDDPFYRDSYGNGQSQGFSINVESNDSTGWYDERTTAGVLYDLYDSFSDGDDTLSLGMGPIYAAFTATSYSNHPAFSSIFSYLAELKSQQTSNATAIEAFAAARGINSTENYGAGEINNGGLASNLPIHKSVDVNGAAVEVCSVNDNGDYNKLGNRAFLKFTATAASHTLTMTKTSGPAGRDPDFVVYKNGDRVQVSQGAGDTSEVLTATLSAGDYVIDAYDYTNVGNQGTSGDSCYNFTITR